jgi:hypothetical protein
MYDEYKVFGPYKRKDFRKVIILQHIETKKLKTISYPKYIMKCHLKRYLSDDETIDHIDNNCANNNLENLQILSRVENAKKSFIDVPYEHRKIIEYDKDKSLKHSFSVQCELNPISKFTNNQVKQLREMHKQQLITISEISDVYDVTYKTARDLIIRKTYSKI